VISDAGGLSHQTPDSANHCRLASTPAVPQSEFLQQKTALRRLFFINDFKALRFGCGGWI
jgi:hypothetical protein